MSLSAKIFLAFFIFFSAFLGFTVFFTLTKTENHETARISDELLAAQQRFHSRLKRQQDSTLKLVQTITLDQKFRSFLHQIKDNFYSFTEEVAMDADADLVFMVDDTPQIRGIYPANENSLDRIHTRLNLFGIHSALNDGLNGRCVVEVDGELFSIVSVPLKESLTDDYALGALVVGRRMDDQWLKKILEDNRESAQLQVAIYSGKSLVAGNIPSELGKAVIQKLPQLKDDAGTLLLEDRYIVKRGNFEKSDESIGYVYLSNLDKGMAPFYNIQKSMVLVSFAALIAGLIYSLFFSRRIVRPLKMLLHGTREVVLGKYDFKIEHKSSDEVGKLSQSFNQMVKELKDKKYVQETFGKYVHPTIVAEILANPESLKLGGDRKKQSVLFCDIANFTTYSESMAPEALITLLNNFLGHMTKELIASRGILDQYLGDGFKAYWGPPSTAEDYSLMACQAAINMKKKLEVLRPEWMSQGYPEIRMRIGLSTGNMIVGNIGSESAQEYTCIGDTVNYGARLEGINKFYRTEIIIDYFTCKNSHHAFFVRELDRIQVKGRTQGSRIYELLGVMEDITPEQRKMKTQYEDALGFYMEGKFEIAAKKFQGNAKEFGDPPSLVMYERCYQYMVNPPPRWEGIYKFAEK